jgi:hypothetical protein
LSQPGQNYKPFSNPTIKVALIAVFTALSLGTNYVMIDIPNVKLMDSFVFIAAFLFGLEVGLGSAISIWTIYGFINPWGQAGFPLFFFLVIGECFYAIAGAFLRRTPAAEELLRNGLWKNTHVLHQAEVDIVEQSENRVRKLVHQSYAGTLKRLRQASVRLLPYGRMSLLFGTIGFQATFAYDALTNFGDKMLVTSSLYQAFIIGMITGVPFAILHEASNLAFFAIVVPMAIATSKRIGPVISR